MGVGFSGDGLARRFIRRPVLTRAVPAALVTKSTSFVFVVGQYFLNTTGLACQYRHYDASTNVTIVARGPTAEFINSSALNCSAPALDLPAGAVAALSISLNGEEVAGSLDLVVGGLPVVLQLDPQYAYVGDVNVIVRVTASGLRPDGQDLSCKAGPFVVPGTFSYSTTTHPNGTIETT